MEYWISGWKSVLQNDAVALGPLPMHISYVVVLLPRRMSACAKWIATGQPLDAVHSAKRMYAVMELYAEIWWSLDLSFARGGIIYSVARDYRPGPNASLAGLYSRA